MTAPTKMALVPVEATEEMEHAFSINTAAWADEVHAGWSAALAASPSSGRLTAADLERAAEAHYVAEFGHLQSVLFWAEVSQDFRRERIRRQRAAFAAIGLPVEGEGA